MLESAGAVDPRLFSLVAGLLLATAAASAARWPMGVIDHPRTVLGAILLVTLAAGACLVRLDPPGLRLSIDPSTEPLLPSRDPAREIYRDAIRDFGDDEVFVIALDAGEVFTQPVLQRIKRITDAIAQLDGVRRVQSLTDVVSFRYEPREDWVEVRPFIEEIPSQPDELAELRRRALADPLYRRTLVAEDGRSAAINVSFRKMSDREFIASRIDERIAEILAREGAPGLRVHVAGRPHVKVTVYHLMLRDLRLLIPLAVVAMAFVLGAVFRSVRGVVLPLATVGIATLWTFSAMAVLQRPLSILTTLLAPTLIAIGSVYGVHLVARHEEESRGRSPRNAALRCLEHMRLPVLVAGATTVIGFAALLVSDVPAVFELGAFSALGVASVTVLSLTGLPAALALWRPARLPALPVRDASPESEVPSGRLDGFLSKLARFDLTRRSEILLVGTGLAILAAIMIPRIVIDTDYLSYFDEEAPVRVDFEAVDRLLAGVVPIYVSLRADEPGRFREPEVLGALRALQLRADALPDVSRTESMVDTLRVLNRAMGGGDPEQERIPETRSGVAELLFMAPKGHLDRFTNVNHSRANLIVRSGALGTAAVTDLARRLEALLQDGALPSTLRAGVTGNAILLARSADGIARSQPFSIALAAVAIFILISVSLRSLGLGVVAMVPNVLPVLLFFGLLGTGVAPLSLPTSLIGCVALGIAIDDTVHLLVRYREERNRGRSPEAAVLWATRRVGRPIAITSLMLIAGFCVMALSGFATLREFGLLSAATMAICLASDLLLLPALLVRTRL